MLEDGIAQAGDGVVLEFDIDFESEFSGCTGCDRADGCDSDPFY